MKRIGLFAALVVFAFGCNKAAEDTPAPDAGKVEPKMETKPDEGSGGGTTASASGYSDVQAILTARCVGCHGEGGKEGIDLRTYESVMKGGEHGAIVVAGDPAASQMVKAVRGLDGVKKMPAMGDPLSEADIAKIEAWIKGGAKN